MSTTTCKRCGAPLSTAEAGTALQGMCTKCLFELGLDEESQVVITGAAESPAPPPTPEELQPLFPQFEILELLGQGGMGVVYRARQKGLDREVALKVLPARAGRNPAFAERFAREAKALASLSHPNITSVYDFGKAGEHCYLAMEFVDGLNLRALLRAQRVAPKQALQIVEQICDALQYAHDQGVVHRDIKPENILLDRKGRLKITDFGLAKLLAREAGTPPSIGLTLTDQVMGTPHYMAPEQVERPATVDHRADIYSLGVVFYELLTGELPLGRFAPPSGKVRVDVRLDEVVLRALEKEPELRYQSAGAIRTDVHGITEPGSGEKAAAGAVGAAAGRTHARTPKRAWHWAIAAILLAVFGSLGVGALLFTFLSPTIGSVEPPIGVSIASPQEEQEQAERSARLEGVPLFEGNRLSLPFRTVFGVGDEVRDASANAVAIGWQAYRTAREAHTRREIPEPGVVRVTIDPFPEEARQVVEDMQRRLRALLSPEANDYLLARNALEEELFPAAAERVVHELRRTADGFNWMTFTGDLAAPIERGMALPEELAGYWQEMYQPLGTSVVPTLERFVEEVRAFDAGRGKVVPGRIVLGSKDGDVEMYATVTLQGADVAESSKLLHGLMDRLRAAELWLDEASTRSGDSAVFSVPLRVYVKGEPLDLPVPAPDAPAGDPWQLLPALNQQAAALGIALKSVVPRQASPRDDWEDVSYELPQEDGSVRPLDEQLAWIRALEDLGPDSIVTRVTLEPSTTDGSAWLAKATLLARFAR